MTDYSTLLKTLSKDTNNNKCIDCNDDNPQWTSISHGIFICINCAANHRSYGVNISRVRSVLIDKWNKQEYELIAKGGNARFRQYCTENGLEGMERDELYRHPRVQEYRTQFVSVEQPRRYVAQQRQEVDVQPNTFLGWKSFVADKAVMLKNKSVEIGSKINKQYIVPGIAIIKEKTTGRTVKKVESPRKTEDVASQVESKRDYRKWD